MSAAMPPLLAATPLLDIHHPIIEALVATRGCRSLSHYARHGSKLSGLKRWLYERVIRHAMNRNVARVRASKW